MTINKPKLAIITEGLRRDNQKPLSYFDKLKIIHFYENAPYGHETKDELKDAIKFSDYRDLYKKIISEKPDIIQGTEPYGSRKMFLFSIVSYFAAKKLQIPLIFPFYENRPAKERFNFFQRILVDTFTKKYIDYANKVFYLNNGALKNIHKLGIDDNNKLIKFLWGIYGVDVNEFCPSKNIKPKGINDKIILYVGRLVHEKGIKYLLESFKKVHKRFPNAQLVFIGSGDLKSHIEEFRKNNNLENYIVLKGSIPNKDLPAYYQHATIFVSPSITIKKWEEQVGMTNIQAMSCGLPVVSTTSGGIPEYVPNKIAGLLVPERDSDRLSSAIISLLDDNRLRDRLSIQAREYAIKHYDLKNNVKKAEDYIIKILNTSYEK